VKKPRPQTNVNIKAIKPESNIRVWIRKEKRISRKKRLENKVQALKMYFIG
jgi:hypothetical protein